jgi:hypothetical protein
MNPITDALFYAIPEKVRFDMESALHMLVSLGQSPKRKGPYYVFEYTDDLHFHVCISTADQKSICTISLSAYIPGDEAGWSGWSKEKEMDRLKIQADWLSKRSLTDDRISNLFSPQDGSSSIVIER